MPASDANELAALFAASAGLDPDDDRGLRFIGVPTASESGDAYDYRWSASGGLTFVGPTDHVSTLAEAPVVVSREGGAWTCEARQDPFADEPPAEAVEAVLVQCSGDGSEPDFINFGCRSESWFEQVAWDSWGGETATGHGVHMLRNCEAACALSTDVIATPVTIELSAPQSVVCGDGAPVRVYTVMTVRNDAGEEWSEFPDEYMC